MKPVILVARYSEHRGWCHAVFCQKVLSERRGVFCGAPQDHPVHHSRKMRDHHRYDGVCTCGLITKARKQKRRR